MNKTYKILKSSRQNSQKYATKFSNHAVREHDGRAERRELVLEKFHRVLAEVEPRRVVECEVSVHWFVLSLTSFVC